MPDIDLTGATARYLLEEAIKRHGETWLHILSKTSYFSRQYIMNTLNEHLESGDFLDKDFTTPLQDAFLEEKAEYIDSVIRSRFEVLQMTSSSLNNTIKFIKISIDGVVIHLDFYDQSKVPSMNDCVKTMQSNKIGFFNASDYPSGKEEYDHAERWLSVLETLKSEGLNFTKILQSQLSYLSKIKSYKAPDSFGTNVSRIAQLYEKKNRTERYIKTTADIFMSEEMIFCVDYADILINKKRG